MSQRRSILATAFLASLVAPTACSNKPGSPCFALNNDSACFDAQTVLRCEDTTFRGYACRGAKGCSGTPPLPDCDQRVANPGDTCRTSTSPADLVDLGAEGLACSPDGGELLTCGATTFQSTIRCNGPRGCTMSPGSTVDCDVETAVAGEPCGWPATLGTCSTDFASELFCDTKTQRWSKVKTCEGASHCVRGGCQPFARPGEACTADSMSLCSEDGRSILPCQNGKRSAAVACDGPRGCWRRGMGQGIEYVCDPKRP